MNIIVQGAATTRFGELWHKSFEDLGNEAIQNAIKNSNIDPERIDALFVGNMLAGSLSNQSNIGSLFSQVFGRNIPAFRIEGACASGGLALHTAVNSLLAGSYKTVLVLGIEKMTDVSQDEVTAGLMSAGSEEERISGITFPGIYALLAQAYMKQFNVSEEDLAAVSVKNHYHGSLNQNAQFQTQITVDQVLKSAKVAYPLKLLDSSPISDGASAIVITSDLQVQKKLDQRVAILASEVATDTLGLADRNSFTSLSAVVSASQNAYKKAQILPEQIDVAEIHDCFSIAEAIATEDLGFSKRGQGAKDIAAGNFTLGFGKVTTNPSGGLKACGHPVGATGIKQIVEITEQLRGNAGKRQHKHAKTGLTHNVGGSGAVTAIHILQNQNI